MRQLIKLLAGWLLCAILGTAMGAIVSEDIGRAIDVEFKLAKR